MSGAVVLAPRGVQGRCRSKEETRRRALAFARRKSSVAIDGPPDERRRGGVHTLRQWGQPTHCCGRDTTPCRAPLRRRLGTSGSAISRGPEHPFKGMLGSEECFPPISRSRQRTALGTSARTTASQVGMRPVSRAQTSISCRNQSRGRPAPRSITGRGMSG
jgi:hypothetical protein